MCWLAIIGELHIGDLNIIRPAAHQAFIYETILRIDLVEIGNVISFGYRRRAERLFYELSNAIVTVVDDMGYGERLRDRIASTISSHMNIQIPGISFALHF